MKKAPTKRVSKRKKRAESGETASTVIGAAVQDIELTAEQLKDAARGATEAVERLAGVKTAKPRSRKSAPKASKKAAKKPAAPRRKKT